jgi:hypothetical protein
MIDHYERSGRTRRRGDGSYESLDLVKARAGDQITIVTEQGTHTFTKGDVDMSVSAMEGWIREYGEHALASTVLVLLERTKSGTSFLTPRVVLREGIEVGAIDTGSDTPNVIRSLGVIGMITVSLKAGTAQKTV